MRGHQPQYGLKYDPYGFALGTPPVLPPRGKQIPPRVLAETSSHTLLRNQLKGYTLKEVKGRSFLIAGPRGSGKTTLIRSICEEAAANHVDGCRVIEVRLHGPSLFKPPTPAPTTADPKPAPISVDEHVLKTIVINLYQTAAEEVVNAYRDLVAQSGDEALELAAQLRLTLDGAPSAAMLRFFWEKAGAWPGGVLFPALSKKHQAYQPDQAAAEIVALATASDAYRRCTGELKQESVDERTASNKEESKVEVNAGGKELAQALMSVVTGVAAGSAAAALGKESSVAVIAGAVTALLSMITLHIQRTRTRETAIKEAVTFLPDTRASALVHRVLLLLRRLRQAGFVPVFIVDELDKVNKLTEPLNQLTSSLKFLFADEAFFCFLTDRKYFLEIAQINRDHTNSVEKTTFSNQMLIRYETRDLQEYLSSVVKPHGNADPDTAFELEADAEALRYILIQRSRMLMFELGRAIADITGEDFWLTLRLKEPREVLVNQFHLMIQLAIELVLIEPDVANRIARDPDFAPTIYDGLYYPTRHWYKDSSLRLKCTPDNLVEGIQEMTGESLTLAPPDQKFLHAQVKRLLDLVSNPLALDTALSEADKLGHFKVSAPVRQAIPLNTLLKHSGEDEYEWIYNRYGTHNQAGDVQNIVNNDELWKGFDILDKFSTFFGETLSRRNSPAEVLAAIDASSRLISDFTGMTL